MTDAPWAVPLLALRLCCFRSRIDLMGLTGSVMPVRSCVKLGGQLGRTTMVTGLT